MSKIKTSTIVASQLPDFIRDDYPAFIQFIEAYYEFLEQADPKDLAQIRSIDDTLDVFIDHFKAELANNLPNVIVDQRELLQRLKAQYLSKGTEASYKLLFRLLYNKEVVVDYPGKQMLRASDGRWYQDVSIFARIKRGDPASVVGQYVEVITPTKNVSIRVDQFRHATVYDRSIETGESIASVSSDIVELFIDRKFYGEIFYDNIIKFGNIFEAAILPTTSKVKVVTRGSGFKAGQLYNIRSSLGEGTVLKISRVNSEGGIQSAQLIKFGVGYTTDFSTTISPPSTETFTPLTIIGNNVTVNDKTGGFVETGLITKDDYSDSAFNPTYSGEVLREFYYDDAQVPDPENAAQLQFTLGPLAIYPGYYTSNLGFLDDAIYVQDGHYYQAYSYILKIDERLSSYKNAVKTLLHPAGMALFGGYELKNEFSVSPEVISILQFLAMKLETVLDSPIDEILGKAFGKALNDTQTILEAITSKGVVKALSDTLDTPTENVTKEFGKATSDTLDQPLDSNIKNIGKALSDASATSDVLTKRDFGKALTDSSTITESNVISISKPLTENQSLSDSNALAISKPLTDSQSLSDSKVITINKSLTDSSLTSDIIDSIDFNKSLIDSIAAGELCNIGFVKDIISDSVSISEVLTMAVDRVMNLADSFTVTDVISSIEKVNYYISDAAVSEILSFVTGKGFSDFIDQPSDSSTLVINKSISDSATSSEAGFVEFNPYIDPAYTYVVSGEHYVGERTTF